MPLFSGGLFTWTVLFTPRRFGTPGRGRQTPLAEGMETRQQLGLSVVEAQLADGTCVHQPEANAALQFEFIIHCWQTFGLVFHDDNNVVIDIFGTIIHFRPHSLLCSLTVFPIQLINTASIALSNRE